MNNYSSFVNDCNFGGPIHSIGWRISIAILQLLLSLFQLSTVLYLSLVLKKRAWDSPAKRFGHFFNLYFALTFLFLAIANFYLYSVAILILQYPYVIAFLNFAAFLVALSLQFVAPFLPENVKKQYARRSHCVRFAELILHVVLFILLVLSVTFLYCSPTLVLISTCFSTIILFLSFGVLVFTYIKFFKNPNINKSIKYVILKLAFVIIICIFFIISTVILADSLVLWLLHIVLNFFLTLSVVSLNSQLHIWCYVCYLRKSQSRVPLLPINDTERQQTNPLSVLDHRNVPSYTVTNLPFEMSDCRSDY